MALDPARSRFDHVAALDGLRFLAAAVVLVGHCFNCLAKPPAVDAAFRNTPLAVFINGYGAVHLFFVLSGFCLAGSADRARRPAELAQFYVRRVFRIHPPYMFALALAWVASFAYDTSRAAGGLTPYLMQRADVHLSLQELLPYFLYPSHARQQLGPAWTLFVEMNFSFLLPAMLWLTRRTHWAVLVGLSVVPLFDGGALPGFLDYGIYFALGITIFLERERLGRALSSLPTAARGAWLLLGLLTFAAPFVFGLVFAAGFAFAPSGLLLSAAACTLLLLAAIHFPGVGERLSGRALAFGGRISYSFYLLHYPVLILATRWVRGPVDAPLALAFVALVFAGTAAAAALAFPAVERPSIRAGNALCRAIARRSDAAAQLSRLAA